MNVIDQAKAAKQPLVLLFADTEKVFDRIDWVFMTRVLGKMGFGRYSAGKKNYFISC